MPALFRDLLSGLKADTRLAVANFAGVSATHVRTYVSDLLATKPREPLLGPGGPSLNRGAVARHVFLAHAVATLIKAHEKDWRLALEKASTPAPSKKQKRRRLSDVSRALNDAEQQIELVAQGAVDQWNNFASKLLDLVQKNQLYHEREQAVADRLLY